MNSELGRAEGCVGRDLGPWILYLYYVEWDKVSRSDIALCPAPSVHVSAQGTHEGSGSPKLLCCLPSESVRQPLAEKSLTSSGARKRNGRHVPNSDFLCFLEQMCLFFLGTHRERPLVALVLLNKCGFPIQHSINAKVCVWSLSFSLSKLQVFCISRIKRYCCARTKPYATTTVHIVSTQ